MSQEAQPQEAGDPQRRWWPWLLAGGLLGILFASYYGAAIGLAVEGVIVVLVNRLPESKVRTVFGALFVIGCAALAGAGSALLLFANVRVKKELLLLDLWEKGDELTGVSTWVLIGGLVGGLVATCDRLFMWVVYPYGVEPPPESIDVPDPDAEIDE